MIVVYNEALTQKNEVFKMPKAVEMPSNKLFINLTGHIYGEMTVVSYAGERNKTRAWNCQCSCGAARVVAGGNLRSGKSKSCGCADSVYKRQPHGKHGTPEYNSYNGMMTRCYNKNNNGYHNYGGRGITVCDRWRDNPQNFFDDMGDKPSPKHSIDRINNDGNYQPDNCKWSTPKEQLSNRRPSRISRNNSSGHIGVYWIRRDRIWQAQIKSNNRLIYLGSFDDKQDAINARKEAELVYHNQGKKK